MKFLGVLICILQNKNLKSFTCRIYCVTWSSEACTKSLQSEALQHHVWNGEYSRKQRKEGYKGDFRCEGVLWEKEYSWLESESSHIQKPLNQVQPFSCVGWISRTSCLSSSISISVLHLNGSNILLPILSLLLYNPLNW